MTNEVIVFRWIWRHTYIDHVYLNIFELWMINAKNLLWLMTRIGIRIMKRNEMVIADSCLQYWIYDYGRKMFNLNRYAGMRSEKFYLKD